MRKIVDDQSETNGPIRLSVPAIYESIKRSNSSLNRKPKKPLEDSLERVLEVVKADLGDEEEEEDSVEGNFEGLEEESGAVPVCWVVSFVLFLSPGHCSGLIRLGIEWRQ